MSYIFLGTLVILVAAVASIFFIPQTRCAGVGLDRTWKATEESHPPVGDARSAATSAD
jgi:hypothetical protein